MYYFIDKNGVYGSAEKYNEQMADEYTFITKEEYDEYVASLEEENAQS